MENLPQTNTPPPYPVPSIPVQPQTEVSKQKTFPKFLIFVIGGIVLLAALGIGGYFWLHNKKQNTIIEDKDKQFSPVSSAQSSVTPAYNSSDPEIAKYDKDSDGNAIPDFVEEAMGYDPLVDDCARDVDCELGNTGTYDKKPDNTLLILDSSGSMGLALGNETRMSAAKAVIKEWINNFDEDQNVGLMVYGHKGSNSAADKNFSCAGIDILYSLAPIDKQKFNTAIDSFQATGWTPIATSLLKARNEVFAGHESENNHIILVSDGEEMCGGDPVETAKELKNSNINVIIDVIGLSADQAAKIQLKNLAEQGGGKYYDTNSKEEFQNALKQYFDNFFLLTSENVCIQKNYNNWMFCLGSMLNGILGKYEGKGVINNYLSPLCTQLQKEGKTQEYKKCQETIKKINDKYTETIKQMDEEKMQRYNQSLEEIEKNEQENNPVNN